MKFNNNVMLGSAVLSVVIALMEFQSVLVGADRCGHGCVWLVEDIC